MTTIVYWEYGSGRESMHLFYKNVTGDYMMTKFCVLVGGGGLKKATCADVELCVSCAPTPGDCIRVLAADTVCADCKRTTMLGQIKTAIFPRPLKVAQHAARISGYIHPLLISFVEQLVRVDDQKASLSIDIEAFRETVDTDGGRETCRVLAGIDVLNILPNNITRLLLRPMTESFKKMTVAQIQTALGTYVGMEDSYLSLAMTTATQLASAVRKTLSSGQMTTYLSNLEHALHGLRPVPPPQSEMSDHDTVDLYRELLLLHQNLPGQGRIGKGKKKSDASLVLDVGCGVCLGVCCTEICRA
jgi:hypothetical protein